MRQLRPEVMFNIMTIRTLDAALLIHLGIVRKQFEGALCGERLQGVVVALQYGDYRFLILDRLLGIFRGHC